MGPAVWMSHERGGQAEHGAAAVLQDTLERLQAHVAATASPIILRRHISSKTQRRQLGPSEHPKSNSARRLPARRHSLRSALRGTWRNVTCPDCGTDPQKSTSDVPPRGSAQAVARSGTVFRPWHLTHTQRANSIASQKCILDATWDENRHLRKTKSPIGPPNLFEISEGLALARTSMTACIPLPGAILS